MTLTVRQTTKRDMIAIDALLAASYPKLLKVDYPPSVLVLALPIISRAQPRLVASGQYYLAEDDGGNLRAAGGWSVRPGRPGRADIRHVVSDAAYQRKGAARAILTRVFEEAAAAGVTSLDCQSTRTAVPFYQAMGFTPLGPIEVPLAPGIVFPAIQMHREL